MKKLMTAVAVLSIAGLSAHAQNWTGAVSSDWDNTNNWDAPYGGSAIIETLVPNYPIISSTPTNSGWTDIRIGANSGALTNTPTTGRVDVVSGTLPTGNGNWTFVGDWNGDAVLNIADTSGSGGTYTGYGQGSGSFNSGGPALTGNLIVGLYYSTGELNVNTTGSVNAGNIYIAPNSGSNSAIAGGTFNLDSGNVNVTGDVQVGSDFWGAGCGPAYMNMSGGALDVGANLRIGWRNLSSSNAISEMMVTGGTIDVEGDVVVGWAGISNAVTMANSSAKLTLTDGATLNQATTTYRWLVIGNWDTTDATLEVLNGASVNLHAGVDIMWGDGNNSGARVLTVDNASLIGDTNGGSYMDLNRNGNTAGSSTVNIKNGALVALDAIIGAPSSVVNFDNATYRATTSDPFYLGDMTINILSGGVTFDTDGKTNTIRGKLNGSGGGGMTKTGAGKLTLIGGLSYTGPTRLEEGSMTVDLVSSPVSGNLVVSNGTTLTLNTVNGTGSLDLGGGGTANFYGNTTLNVQYGSGASPAPLITAIGGSATSSGTCTINVTGTGIEVGTYPLFLTGVSTPATGFTLVVPSTITAHLNNSGTSLDLVVDTAGQNLTWYGADSSGTVLQNTWNLSAMNWDAGTATYMEYGTYGDNTTFDENYAFGLAGATNVNLPGRVTPQSVLFDDHGVPSSYSLTGAGGIDGSTSLVLSNTMSLFLGTSNSYAGGTFVGPGATLSITNQTALGSNSVSPTLQGGTLQLNAGTPTFTRHIDVGAASSLGVPTGATVQFAGSVTGSGVSKTGAGTLDLTAADAVSVEATVTEGILKLSDADAMSNGVVNVGIDNGVSFLNGIGTFNVRGLSGVGSMGLADTAAAVITLNVGATNGAGLYDGVLYGGGSLVKVGTGAQRLNGTNTYSGGTTVLQGELSAQAGASPGAVTAFGTGAVTADGSLSDTNSLWNGAIITLNGGVGDAFGSYSYANDFNLINGGRCWAWDGSARVQGDLNVGTGGGSVGSTFDAPWEVFAETNFPKSIFFDGFITGTGPLTVAAPGWQSGNPWNTSCAVFTSTGTPAQNTYSGTVTVEPFTVGSSGGSYLYLVGTTVMANATINLTGDNDGSGRMGIPTLLFGNGSTNGAGMNTIGGLSGSGSVMLNETILFTGGTGFTNGNPVALSVGYNNASTTYSGALSGTGSLIKIGTGTLTLSGTNNYSGDTTVSAGTLELAQSVPTLDTNTTVTIASGATLLLSDASVINQVTGLVTNGVPAADGLYDSANSSGFITGSGKLLVGAATVPTTPVPISVSLSGSTLTLDWGETGWYLQAQTNSLSNGLQPTWVTLPGYDAATGATITVDKANGTVFYRLTNTP